MVEERVELGVIANRKEVLDRAQAIAQQFGYSFKAWSSLDEFLAGSTTARVVIAYAAEAANKEAAAEYAQGIRFQDQDCFLMCVVSAKLGKDVASFVKKSGANLILLDDELMNSSKLEYSCTQTIKADYIPIKVSDLAPGKPLGFDLNHLLPMRGKFLRFAFEGDIVSAEKVKKVSDVGELYIRKTQTEKFNQYIASNADRSAAGLARRCRSQFLALYTSYAELVLLLTDQSEHASFREGEALLKKCREMAGELMITLGDFGNAWDVVNNSTVGEFGSTERAPAIAAYVALFGLQLGMDRINDMMIATMLVDLGLLLLPPEVSRKLRAGQLSSFSAEETRIYHQYPLKSLDVVLSRKLPIDEKLRELILATHERADGKGFPRGDVGRHLTEEAQLIHFCREFDRRTRVVLGRARVDHEAERRLLIQEELDHPSRFSPVFVEKLKNAFLK